MAASAAIQQRVLTYSGHVQGVGFRYTARAAAANYAVTGYVRNLPDGRVELLAEGAAAELDAFLASVRERMDAHIRKVTCDRRPATGEFSEFEIRH